MKNIQSFLKQTTVEKMKKKIKPGVCYKLIHVHSFVEFKSPKPQILWNFPGKKKI
jgi:hypothetical protein